MAFSQRLCGPILTNISTSALFAGVDELERMKAVRVNITKIRRIWQNTTEFNALKVKIKSYIRNESISSKLKAQLAALLTGYSDWADMDYGRPKNQRHGWTAIEIYCSEEGYNLFFGLFNAILRQKEVEDDLLLISTALVEFVTIELYNFRLTNIGNPKYENFEGVVFRGMSISKKIVAEYKKAASNPDLSKRHFGVPLGFTSSSTSKGITEEFMKLNPGEDQMHWTIHVHGLDPQLLQRYRALYPDSVVTSITAMPVGQVADLRENEILLRGAFFHIIHLASRENDGRMIHEMQLVTLNTNRDHGTELALDEGPKQEQRNFFRDMIMASRYEICAELSKLYSLEDAKRYEELARAAIQRIDAADHLGANSHLELTLSKPKEVSTWYGDKTGQSLPSNYLALRRKFCDAAQSGDWVTVRDTIEKEYEWELAEWLNAMAFDDPWRGRTLLHEIADYGPPTSEQKEIVDAWGFLLEKVNDSAVWRTLRTADTFETAQGIAIKNGHENLAGLLQPRVSNRISSEALQSYENQLQSYITKALTQHELEVETFQMPQLSIITEQKDHSLWIPIPQIFGGFLVQLDESTVLVEKFETMRGHIGPCWTGCSLRIQREGNTTP